MHDQEKNYAHDFLVSVSFEIFDPKMQFDPADCWLLKEHLKLVFREQVEKEINTFCKKTFKGRLN